MFIKQRSVQILTYFIYFHLFFSAKVLGFKSTDFLKTSRFHLYFAPYDMVLSLMWFHCFQQNFVKDSSNIYQAMVDEIFVWFPRVLNSLKNSCFKQFGRILDIRHVQSFVKVSEVSFEHGVLLLCFIWHQFSFGLLYFSFIAHLKVSNSFDLIMECDFLSF